MDEDEKPAQIGPDADALISASPNPWTGSGSFGIRFVLARENHVRVEVFAVGGRKLKTILDDTEGAGSHEVLWDGTDETNTPVATGVYFYRLEFAGRRWVGRVLLTR